MTTATTPAPRVRRPTRNLAGIALASLAMLLFASQDALTKLLVQDMPISTVLLVRYCAFTVFATLLLIGTSKTPLARVFHTSNFWGQAFRGFILVAEIFVFSWGVRHLDMGVNHALFSVFPLVITALAWPVLGESVGPWRWSAVIVGFLGALIIIRPGFGVISPYVIFPLIGACMYAAYNIVTRLTGRGTDSFQTSLFYLAVVGLIGILPFGLWQWQQPLGDQIWMLALLCITSIAGHSALILALMLASASTLQPFNYLLLVFATIIGMIVFQERLELWTLVGATVIVGSGLVVIARERIRKTGENAPPRSSPNPSPD